MNYPRCFQRGFRTFHEPRSDEKSAHGTKNVRDDSYMQQINFIEHHRQENVH